MPDTFTLDLVPVGRRIQITADQTLLEAAQQAGIEIVAHCGGAGTCGRCRVRRVEGQLTPPTSAETSRLDADRLAAGWRLACQAKPLGDLKIEIPPESLRAQQRLQIEGEMESVHVDPAVKATPVVMAPPSHHNLRADADKLFDMLRKNGFKTPWAGRRFLASYSESVRGSGWEGKAVTRGEEVIAFLPAEAPVTGLAVDIGTTSLAAYLVDLEDGRVLAKSGAMNPQIAYGEDVVSRIATINTDPENRAVLQGRVVDTINGLVKGLCEEAGTDPAWIADSVIVGNTAMAHIFAGLPVKQLGEAPYLPAISAGFSFAAEEIGLEFAPGAEVYLPPNIAGYIGSDHIAAILATELVSKTRPTIMIDVGTNTELSLIHEGAIYSTSCASGPAFEGAHISAGMRAAPGAIERVWLEDDAISLSTIGDETPVGICGSGILDVVAVMAESGLLTSNGRLNAKHPLAGKSGDLPALVLHEDDGRSVAVIRKDVAEIQLAKSAIRTGIETLIKEAGLKDEDLAEFIIAGAFGSYIGVEAAITVGMFPPIPESRFTQVGNAAGMGAVKMLLSTDDRRGCETVVPAVNYIELTTYPDFQDAYMSWMSF